MVIHTFQFNIFGCCLKFLKLQQSWLNTFNNLIHKYEVRLYYNHRKL